MRNRNFQVLSNDELEAMTSEELITLMSKHKSEIANFKRSHFKKKILEMECCYIQRELEFRSTWLKSEPGKLKFAKP